MPWCRNTTSSESCAISSMLCSISSTVLPRSTSRRTIGTIVASESVSSPEVGSSSRSTSASVAKMRAIDSSFCSGIGQVLGELVRRARPGRRTPAPPSRARAPPPPPRARGPGAGRATRRSRPSGVRQPSSTFSSTRHLAPQAQMLERAHHAGGPRTCAGPDRAAPRPCRRIEPRVGAQEAGDQVEDGGLAGAVRSDQPGDQAAAPPRRCNPPPPGCRRRPCDTLAW